MKPATSSSNPYLARFGLDRDPFSDTPDSNFFLLDSERAQRLNMLYHLTQNSDALLLLTGCKGSGKTSLIHKFLDMGSDTWRYCLVRANTMMNPEQLLRHIAEGFGLEPDGINFANAIETLRKRLIELHRSGLIALLIIDDAHELPAASLTVIMKLSELRDDDEGLLRILLFSEAQIGDMLAAPELSDVRHRISHTLDMPALNEQQTIDYIQYRLNVAGADERPPLSRSQMKKIHRLSQGIPLRINEHARAMLHGSTLPARQSSLQLKPILTIIGLLVVAAVLTYFLSQNLLHELFNDRREQSTAMLELPVIPPAAHVEVEPPPAEPGAVAEPPPAEEAASPAIRVTGPATPPTASSPVEEIRAEAAETPAALAMAPSTSPVARQRPPETATIIEEKQPVTQPATPLQRTPVDWFAQQNPAHFTLQLLGSHARETVESFRRQHRLDKDAAVVTTRHEGSAWYVLVYGSYPDKDRARAAVAGLPAPLQQARPWPRRIGDLQGKP